LHYKFQHNNQPLFPISNLSELKDSNIQIGLTMKKSEKERLQIRLEFYIQSNLWMSLSDVEKCEIKYLQLLTEDWMNYTLERQKKPSPQLTHVRDSIQIKLLKRSTTVCNNNQKYSKIEWFLPSSYKKLVEQETIIIQADDIGEVEAFPIGLVTICDLFSEDQLNDVESKINQLNLESQKRSFQRYPNTRQPTIKHSKLVRTKFFFGSRYLWPGNNTNEKGIRTDVAPPPSWIKDIVEEQLTESSIIPPNWVNQYSTNIYHDGSMGIQSHFDDADKFERPIASLRLFTASRLCFGAEGIGMSNVLFFVPLPRGCVTLMGPGFASDGIKHCIRSCDISGKSASILLRRVHPHLLE